MKTIAQGAEAIISLEKNIIHKNRIKKSYRIPALDEKLRKQRTKKEAKVLQDLQEKLNVPKIISQKRFELEIEFINGDKLSEKLNSYKKEKQFKIMRLIGEQISKMHSLDIIHGDLTTSNMILKDNNVFIIDFGLSIHSKRIEDKAVDLHLLKQALEAKHFQNWENLFKEFVKKYNNSDSKKVLEQLKKVESRGRYKH